MNRTYKEQSDDVKWMVLHSPFNISTHKKTFINYLEVVILEDGTIEYAVPSHQEKMISVCMKKFNITRQELLDKCPPDFYADFNYWLCLISKAISVWDFGYEGNPNKKQAMQLKKLKLHGLYRGKLPLFLDKDDNNENSKDNQIKSIKSNAR